MTNFDDTEHCPCGTGKPYSDCCGVFISGHKTPSTPEELMRSRYTAYNLVNLDYIAQTMKSPAADGFNVKNAEEWAQKIRWTRLEVIKTTQAANKGMVEFRAHYFNDGKNHVLHEISEFRFDNGQWFYVDGTQPSTTVASRKTGRNDLCPCGSNKKYKKCCQILKP